MCIGHSRARITSVILSVFIAGWLAACASKTPTSRIPSIKFPVVNIPGTPTATSQIIIPGTGGSSLIRDTPTLSLISTPAPNPTIGPTPIPTKQETLLPSPTVTQAVIWGSGIPQAVTLEHFRGEWFSNEDTLIGNILIEPDFGAIYQAEAPRFALVLLEPGQQGELGSNFTISPNGRWVVYGSVPLAVYSPDWTEYSTLTRFSSQNGQVDALLTGEGQLRWLSFPGWLDNNTVAISDLIEDGFYHVSIVDISDRSVLASARARGPVGNPNPIYLPVVEEDGGPYQLFVLTRSSQMDPYETISGPSYYGRGFPAEYVAPGMSVIFKDWLSGTNQMLVQAFLSSRTTFSITHSLLMLWDVDARMVQALIYTALDGGYSPDGQWLAYTTFGPAPINVDRTPSFDLGFQVPNNQQAYLQLMDVNSSIVRFSLPAVTALDLTSRYVLDVFDTPMAFSNDSRYLAFLTPNVLINDSNGKLEVLPVDQESVPCLSVLDIFTLQTLLSTPAGASKDIYFSPDNDWLSFKGGDGNWYLLNLGNSQIQPLTIFGGENLVWNGWSFDGTYCSFYEPVTEGLGKTIILGPIP